MKKVTFFVLLSFLVASSAFARPQYSILQSFGTKCTGCHVNVQGGGARTNPGFYSRKEISLIDPSWIGLSGFYEPLTNSFLDDMVTVSLDFRYQNAKWGAPHNSKRDGMVMQFSPAIAITPFDWLTAEGFLNVGYFIEKEKRYGAQQPGAGSLIVKPWSDLPSLRVGYFQPPIGQKWDDHTILLRNVTNNQGRKPLIPDDYAELGAQLDYEALDWLSASVGVFSAQNLAGLNIQLDRSDPNSASRTSKVAFVDSNSVSTVLRGVISPPEFLGLTAFGGGEILINRDLYISSLFVNFGMQGMFSVMTEYMRSQKKDSRLTMNFLVDVTYQLTESVLPYVRLERGITKEVPTYNATTRQYTNDAPYYVNQYVIGAHINLLPFIDLLPEYRIFDREDPKYSGTQNQWAFQLHIFY
jgi:hypothetical protein